MGLSPIHSLKHQSPTDATRASMKGLLARATMGPAWGAWQYLGVGWGVRGGEGFGRGDEATIGLAWGAWQHLG